MSDKKTICLNMIVKNEAHIIADTLEHLLKYITFDYWVISDTGSTDATKQIIRDFFAAKGVPGELVEHEWQDFGHNRTKAFESAYNKTDYVFVWDADDEISGDFKMPVLVADSYKFIFGNASGFRYSRPQMFNNRKKWCYRGVLHEYAASLETVGPCESVLGPYYFISGRKGDRSKDPNKYLKDALVLEKALEAGDKDPLYARYVYYCAQSYNSCNRHEKAIEYYKKALTVDTWIQEKYVSCFEIYEQYERLGRAAEGLYYLVESFKYDSTRVEGIYRLIKYYCINKPVEVAYAYYGLISDFYENRYDGALLGEKLFAKKEEYDFYLPYYMIIVAQKTGHMDVAVKMYLAIFKNAYVAPEWWIRNLVHNFQFCVGAPGGIPKNTNFLQLMLDYFELVRARGIVLEEVHYGIIGRAVDTFREELCRPLDVYPLCLGPFAAFAAPAAKPRVMLTVTTCKRLDLFTKTVNSILNTWTDVSEVDYFYCVDDNSSDEDRAVMRSQYPFFNYYMKGAEERGHRESMNIIWAKLAELRPTYWIHLEDDWLYFKKGAYVGRAIAALETYEGRGVHQVVFNRNYGLMYSDLCRVGGEALEGGLVLHEHREGLVGKNCGYWPHYSLQPSLVRTSAVLELGNYDSPNKFFERDYANRWAAKGYKTAFFDGIYSIHIGKQHWEKDGKNAYALNEVPQFGKPGAEAAAQGKEYEGYSRVFNKAIEDFNKTEDKQALFQSFRAQRVIYGFTENGDVAPDQEAISITKQANPDMYEEYLGFLKGRKAVGYHGSTSNYAAYNNLDSRHIMMSVLLHSWLPESVSQIVEIGGGYGNWMYLNRTKGYDWITIDLPHVGELQKWYLTETGVNMDKWKPISAYDYAEVESLEVDLVIGAHSLSELALNIFEDYFKRVISKSKYFFYCYHMSRPTLPLIEAKNKLVKSQFKLIDSVICENGTVNNCLYINEKHPFFQNEPLPAKGTMSQHLASVLDKIRRGTPFGLIRPSDGERMVMLGQTLTNCDAWTFRSGGKLQKDLLDAVRTVDPNLYIGIPCNTCSKGWNCTPDIYRDFIDTFKVPLAQRTYANIFGNSNWQAFSDFIQTYKKGFFLITSGTATSTLAIKERFIISDKLVDTWDTDGDAETDRLLRFVASKKGELILFSAGPLSKVWIPKCMAANPTNMYVDVGASIDIFTKGVTNRSYTKNDHPFAKESCRFNTVKKNLIYLCVFFNPIYIDLLGMLMKTVAFYSKTDDIDFLILTSKEFKPLIDSLSALLEIPIKTKIFNFVTVFESMCARLLIFDYEDIEKYEKVLYIDTDIIVQNDLNVLFDQDIGDRVYGVKEGVIGDEYFGGWFFDFSKYDKNAAAMNSGTLLFRPSSEIRRIFAEANAHIVRMRTAGETLPLCIDQPFLNYYLRINDKCDIEFMNKYVLLYHDNPPPPPVAPTDVILCHFSWPYGNAKNKKERISKYVTHILNKYTVLKGSGLVGEGPDLTANTYIWNNDGIIKFNHNGVLETKWGNGTYKWLDVNTVEASWHGFSHILRMNSDHTKFLSLRLGDIDCIKGRKI